MYVASVLLWVVGVASTAGNLIRHRLQPSVNKTLFNGGVGTTKQLSLREFPQMAASSLQGIGGVLSRRHG